MTCIRGEIPLHNEGVFCPAGLLHNFLPACINQRLIPSTVQIKMTGGLQYTNAMPKNEFSSHYDAVIIGAGIGGLTTAGLLAKSGLNVCVLEQDTQPGGYLANFSRKGFHFSTSIHWLNQCGADGIVTKIFRFLREDVPKTLPQKRIRRMKGDSYDYLLTHNPDQFRQELIERFPEEEAGIRNFFEASRTIGAAFKKSSSLFRTVESMGLFEKMRFGLRSLRYMLPFFKYVPYSTEKGLKKFFKNEELKKIFCTEEDLISCLAPIGWAYMDDFQHPPHHGSKAFPEWLCDVLKESGGELFLNSDVTKVNIENGRATGVEVTCCGEQRTIGADLVISAGDIETLYRDMLPESPAQQDFLKRFQTADIYSSGVTIYLGLDCDPRELGLGEESIFFSRDDVSRKEQNGGDPEKCTLNVLTPSIADPSLAPEGKGTMMIFVAAELDYADRWKTETGPNGEMIRGDAYKAFKKSYADILLKRVEEQLVPGLRDHIEMCNIATPVTFQRYTKNHGGSMMGARPGMKNMRAKVAGYHTHIPNLYISGHWAEYGGGVPPTVRAAANAVLLITRKTNPTYFKALAGLTDGKLDVETARKLCRN